MLIRLIQLLWRTALKLLSLPFVICVNEQILHCRVPMDVNVQLNLPALKGLLDHLKLRENETYIFDCPYLRTEFTTWIYVLSVQVKACQTTAIVAHNDPVRIKHWNYFEYE